MNGYDKAEQLAKDSLQEARDRGFNSNIPYDDHKFRDIIRMKVERLLADEREKFVVIVRRLTTYVDAYGPRDHLNGAATKKLVREARALTKDLAASSTDEKI
jgi:hypothetical protein